MLQENKLGCEAPATSSPVTSTPVTGQLLTSYQNFTGQHPKSKQDIPPQAALSQSLRCALDILPVLVECEKAGRVVDSIGIRIEKLSQCGRFSGVSFRPHKVNFDLAHWKLGIGTCLFVSDGLTTQADVQKTLEAIQKSTACKDPVFQAIIDRQHTSFAGVLAALHEQHVNQIVCCSQPNGYGRSVESLLTHEAQQQIGDVVRNIAPDAGVLFYSPIVEKDAQGQTTRVVFRFEILAKEASELQYIQSQISELMKDNLSWLRRSGGLGPFLNERSYKTPTKSPFEYCENLRCAEFVEDPSEHTTFCRDCIDNDADRPALMNRKRA